jgi:F0F1-type ATP synthase epsilon subunit
VTILADEAVLADEISVETARAELTAAEAELKRLDASSTEYSTAEQRRRWAEAQLAAARARSAPL